jgi:hypothetical protein
MRKMLRAVVRPENIPLVLAFLISLGFLAFDIIQPIPAIVPSVILAVLAVLASAMLAERIGYFERFEQVLEEIKQGRGLRLQVPVGWEDFERYAEAAKDISVSGGSLAQLVPRYKDFFGQKAKSGCKLRFILLDPNSATLEAVARWAGRPAGRFKGEIETSLSYLGEIAAASRNIEIRLNKGIPAPTVMIFDASQSRGRIRVDLDLHQSTPARRLYFELTRAPSDADKESWYQSFLVQYEKLWSDSEPYMSRATASTNTG